MPNSSIHDLPKPTSYHLSLAKTRPSCTGGEIHKQPLYLKLTPSYTNGVLLLVKERQRESENIHMPTPPFHDHPQTYFHITFTS